LKYLADTHLVIWWDSAPDRVATQARKVLEDVKSEILFSHASLWEMAIKIKLEKLILPMDLELWIDRSVKGNGFFLQPITLQAILGTRDLELNHGDPFDRLLICQALELGIPVLSGDRHWDAYGVERIWD